MKHHSDFQFERQTFMVPDRAPTMSFNVVKDSDFYVDPLRHSRSKRRRQSRDSVFSRHSRRRAMSPRRRSSPTDPNDASQRAKMLFQTSKSRRGRRRPRTQPDRELHERRPSPSSSSQASTPGEMPLATMPVIKPSTSQRVTNRFQRYWSYVDGVMFEFECGLEERVAKNRWLKPLQFVDWNLRGVSQVMFVNNPLSGLIIAAAMLVAAPVTGSLALVACVVANGVALLANLSRSSLKSGLFGYNAVLVGCALALCTVDVEYKFVLAVVGALLSVLFSLTIGSLTIATFNVAPLTVPFNISILLLLAALTTRDVYFGSHPDSVVVTPLDDQVPLSALFFVKALFRGVSQVYVYGKKYFLKKSFSLCLCVLNSKCKQTICMLVLPCWLVCLFRRELWLHWRCSAQRLAWQQLFASAHNDITLNKACGVSMHVLLSWPCSSSLSSRRNRLCWVWSVPSLPQ